MSEPQSTSAIDKSEIPAGNLSDKEIALKLTQLVFANKGEWPKDEVIQTFSEALAAVKAGG